MSATASASVGRFRSGGVQSIARLLVVVVLLGVSLLAVALGLASLLATGSLTARLLGAAGEARGGTYTQDLVAHLGERLRLAAVVLLLPAAGLAVLHRAFERSVRTSLADLTARIGWPAWSTWWAVGGPMLLALGVRIVFLSQPMRYDEALTFNEFASRPLYYGLSFYPDPNNHLLNTLLVHLAFVGFGNQPWVLRLPALLGGVLLVPATYALASVLYDRRAALLSAVLVAGSSYLVEYSTNSRGYTLEALCFMVSLTLGILAVRRDSPSALLLAALAAAVGAYALPTMLYGVLIVAAWVGLDYRRARLSRVGPGELAVGGLLLGLMVAVLYLPVLLVSGADKLAANRFVVPLGPAEFANELPRSLAQTWAFWNRDLPLPIVALLVVGYAAATLADLRHACTPLGLLAPSVCVVVVALQRVAPFERVWLFLLPLYFVLACGGLVADRLVGSSASLAGSSTSLARSSASLAGSSATLGGFSLALTAGLLGLLLAVATISSGSILASGETGAFPDAQAVANSLSGRLQPDDSVLTLLPASLPELQYAFPRAGLPIDALVRPPEQAAHLYVVGPATGVPSVAGWQRPTEIQRYTDSALFILERA